MSKISVLMSTYNEPLEWIRLSVDSILNQTLRPDEFVILLDKPENEKLMELLQDYEAQNPEIKLIINEKNMGLVKSLNKGLGACTGEIIARMDADDISRPDRFEKQLRYMNENSYDFVGCNFEVFYDDVTIKISNRPVTDVCTKKTLRYESCLAHPSWFVKREVYERLQGYRDIDTCEDLDFLQRAALEGFRIGNCKEALLRYRDNPDGISRTKLARQAAIADRICKEYRKNKIMSEKDYRDYVQSIEYSKALKQQTDMFAGLERINKKNLTKIETLSTKLTLYMNPAFLAKKVKRAQVLRWKRIEDEN